MNHRTIFANPIAKAARIALVLALAVCLSIAQALPASATLYFMPGVFASMSDPAYWYNKQQDPTKVLAGRAQINEVNQAGIDGDGTMLQPLKEAREYYYDATQQETLKNGAIDEIEETYFDPICDDEGNVIGHAEVGVVYDIDGNLIDQAYVNEIAANYPTGGAQPTIASQYAIVTTQTVMRAYPTDKAFRYTRDDLDDDNLYLTALRVNEPLIVRAQSVDGNYLLCISSCMPAAWVPAKDVAICKDKDEWLSAWDIPAGQELVVYDYKVFTEYSRQTPNTSRRMLYMGTVLERIDPENAQMLVGVRGVYHNHVCYLPVRNDDGTYAKEPALIAESSKVSEGYLPLTLKNVATVAFNALGQQYGWGGMLDSNDCSGYVRDVYKCFGLELARNTTWQSNLPVRKYNLNGMSNAHKAAAIAQMPLGTVLIWSAHEMLYLGQENDNLYVISASGSVGNMYGDSGTNNTRSVIISTLDTLRGNRSTWLENLTVAIVPYIPGDDQGTDMHDIAFYDSSIQGPGGPYAATGNALQPSITIPGLTEGVDYNVSYKNNVKPGTATVTITGAGDYSGEVTRTFKINPISIARAVVTAKDMMYTGKALKPAPVVKLGAKTLKANVDYTATYKNNVNTGTATVIVTGKGLYEGTARTTFNVLPASIAKAAVSVKNATYTGKALKPAATVKLGATTLKANTDYTVAYRNNVNVGTATVTVTGTGNYANAAKATFNVLPASIAKASVKVRNVTYTGKALKPTPIVKYGSTTLKKGVDYDVTYKNNVKVGTAVATITGKGNFTGALSKKFKVKKAPQTIKAHNVKLAYASNRCGRLAKTQVVDLKKLAGVSAKTAVTYEKRNDAGCCRIRIDAKTGKVIVKRCLKQGTYDVKVSLRAPAGKNYKAAKEKTITLRVVVK